ncbi:iron ABC transporter permease [Ferrimonas balearica]|nr:iron ABC transporter permease [Ferrimonas balearica]
MSKTQLTGTLLLAGLLLCSALSMTVGPMGISAATSAKASLSLLIPSLADSLSKPELMVIQQVRLPRTLLAIAVGALLAQCGAVMQSLFRNPLADPGIIGVSSGAALGAAIAMVLFGSMAPVALFAFIGGLITTLLVYRLATGPSGTSVALMLLAGVAIAALTGAGLGLLNYIASDQALRDLSLWSMGSLAGGDWATIWTMLVSTLVLLLVLSRDALKLNAMLLGESEARHMGIPVQHFKLRLMATTALAVGLAVAVSGPIGFIGLVVPHLARMMVGPDNRKVIPLSAALGALLLLLADMGARRLVSPAELPVGLMTALIGTPFFLYLLLKERRRFG